MSKLRSGFSLILPVLSLSLVFLAAGGAEAQVTRSDRRSIPIPSPTPPVNEPMIISRADDFPDENSHTSTVETIAVPVPSPTVGGLPSDDLESRIRSLEAGRKEDYDTKQKRLLLNLDILTRAEQRSESLRKQMFEMAEKEAAIRTKMDGLENDMRPEMIDRNVAFAGSLRPEELRAARRKNLEAERTNLQNLLNEVQKTRASLDQNLLKADALVDKLRLKLEKDIDAALADDPDPKQDN